MFCTQCGAQNPDGSKFCMTCGASLAVLPHGGQEPRRAPSYPQEQPSPWPEYPGETVPWSPASPPEPAAPWSPPAEPTTPWSPAGQPGPQEAWAPAVQAEPEAPWPSYPTTKPRRARASQKGTRPWLWAVLGFVAVLVTGIIVLAFVWEGSPLRSLMGGTGPDYIAYVNEDGNVAIVLPDGTGELALSDDGDKVDYGPLAWSPDHRWLAAYREDRPGGEHAVWISDAGGEDSQTVELDMQLDCASRIGCLAWSPDSANIALVGYDLDWESTIVLVIDVKSGNADVIADDDELMFASVSWLPDGNRLAVTVLDESAGVAHIETMRSDGSDIERLEVDKEDDMTGFPFYAPKGGRMAYLTYDQSSGTQRLYIAKSDGTDAERIAKADYDLEPLDWSRDGSRLLYYNHGDEELLVYDVRSGDEIAVVDGDGDLDPYDFSAALSPDGKSVTYYNYDYELILFDLETEGDDRIVDYADYFVAW